MNRFFAAVLGVAAGVAILVGLFAMGILQGITVDKTVKQATPKVVEKATEQVTPKVVAKATAEVTERVFKDTVPAITKEVVKKAVPPVVEEATKQAVPRVVEAAVPETVKQAVPLTVAEATPKVVEAAVPPVVEKATPLVVEKAVPLVEAKAKVECCPEAKQPAPKTSDDQARREALEAKAAVDAARRMSAKPSVGAAVVDDTRIKNPDVPPRTVDGEVLLTPLCGGGMGPKLLPEGVKVWRDDRYIVHISGIKPVNVEGYTKPKKPFGSVAQFQGEKGTRFNFQFRCEKGHEHFALITPEMEVFPPDFFGPGIGQDCSDCCGCAFIVK